MQISKCSSLLSEIKGNKTLGKISGKTDPEIQMCDFISDIIGTNKISDSYIILKECEKHKSDISSENENISNLIDSFSIENLPNNMMPETPPNENNDNLYQSDNIKINLSTNENLFSEFQKTICSLETDKSLISKDKTDAKTLSKISAKITEDNSVISKLPNLNSKVSADINQFIDIGKISSTEISKSQFIEQNAIQKPVTQKINPISFEENTIQNQHIQKINQLVSEQNTLQFQPDTKHISNSEISLYKIPEISKKENIILQEVSTKNDNVKENVLFSNNSSRDQANQPASIKNIDPKLSISISDKVENSNSDNKTAGINQNAFGYEKIDTERGVNIKHIDEKFDHNEKNTHQHDKQNHNFTAVKNDSIEHLNTKMHLPGFNKFNENLSSKPLEKNSSIKVDMPAYMTFSRIKLSNFPTVVSDIISSAGSNYSGTAKLILTPKSLGTVFVEISVSDDNIKLNIKAESIESVKAIESSISNLKERLEMTGNKLEQFDVSLYGNEQKKDSNSNKNKKSGRDAAKHNFDFENLILENDSANISENIFRKINHGKFVEKYI